MQSDPALLVGFDKSDDACVYKVNDELALVQTVDFFPPVVDDPYTFGQVDVMAPIVGKTMNCGNISSAVGPYAIDEGLVKAVEPMTEVHIFNTNTQKEIVAQVPVKDGRAVTEGDFSIDGVPGTADSFVDAANPVIFVHPEDFGVTGTEIPSEFNALPNCKEICRKLEVIRGTGAILLGFAKDLEDARINSQTLPKIAFVRKPVAYTAGSGAAIAEGDIDLVGRLFSVNMKMIDAYMGTGAICTVTAANTPGTIVNEIVCGEGKHPDNHVTHVRIGHPWGVMHAYADLKDNPDGTHTVLSGNLDRTARRIMEGYVYVRD